jgi:hypothetical protein
MCLLVVHDLRSSRSSLLVLRVANPAIVTPVT